MPMDAQKKEPNGMSAPGHKFHAVPSDEEEGDVERVLIRLDDLSGELKEFSRSISEAVRALGADQLAEQRRQMERLADDQRRLWDVVHKIQADLAMSAGAKQATDGQRARFVAIIATLASLFSASVAAFLSHLLIR